jgi:hypothetical protein
LANINFSQYSQQQVHELITHVKDFRPLENKDGVCTSLEESALRILTPDKKFPLENLYNKDKETHWCFDHAIQVLKMDTFEITNDNFTTIGIYSNDIENPDLKGLDTSVERQQGVQTCDLIGMVNAVLLDCVNKAVKQKSQQRPWKKHELNNLKKVFDAASAMTAIVNWLPNNTETYDNFKDMHHGIAKKIAPGDEMQQNKANRDNTNKERVLEDAEDNDDDSDHETTTLHLPDGNDSNASDDEIYNEDDEYSDEDEDEDE